MKFKFIIGFVLLLSIIFPIVGCSCKNEKEEPINEELGYQKFIQAATNYYSPTNAFTVKINENVAINENDVKEAYDSEKYYTYNGNGLSYSSYFLNEENKTDSNETWTVSSTGNDYYYYTYTPEDVFNGIEEKYSRTKVRKDYGFYSVVNDDNSLLFSLTKQELGREYIDYIATIYIDNIEIEGTVIIDFNTLTPIVKFYSDGDSYRMYIEIESPSKTTPINNGIDTYNVNSKFKYTQEFIYDEYVRAITRNIDFLIEYKKGDKDYISEIRANNSYLYGSKFDSSKMKKNTELSKHIDNTKDTYSNPTIHYHIDGISDERVVTNTSNDSFKPQDWSNYLDSRLTIENWYLDSNYTIKLDDSLFSIPSSHLDLYAKTKAKNGYAIVILDIQIREENGTILCSNREMYIVDANSNYVIPSTIEDKYPVAEVIVNGSKYDEFYINLKNQGYYNIEIFTRI